MGSQLGSRMRTVGWRALVGCTAVAALVLVPKAAPASAAHTRAAATSSWLVMRSDPLDTIGIGGTYSYTSADTSFVSSYGGTVGN